MERRRYVLHANRSPPVAAETWGRLVEAAARAHLVNSASGNPDVFRREIARGRYYVCEQDGPSGPAR